MKKLTILFVFTLVASMTGISMAAETFKADLSGAKIPPVATAATGEAIFSLAGAGAGTGGVGDTAAGPNSGVDPGDIALGMAGPGLGEGQGRGSGGIGQTSDPGSYSGIVDRDIPSAIESEDLYVGRNYGSSGAFTNAFSESSYSVDSRRSFGSGAGGPVSGTALHYELKVADIENVSAAHLHMGKRTSAEGPVVATLFPGPKKAGEFSGNLARGMITARDLSGPLQGKTVDELVRMMRSGDVYVNVHTDRHPSGEIRGQVERIS